MPWNTRVLEVTMSVVRFQDVQSPTLDAGHGSGYP